MNKLIKEKNGNPKYKPFQSCNDRGFFDDIQIIETLCKNNKPSKNSLMFAGEPEAAIRNAFKITDPGFTDMFNEACSGEAMEERRIATLHSSSLLSLLFFHPVNGDNPIRVESGTGITGSFVAKRFEHKNPITPGHCSNIDVRLDDKDGNITLFLESKYSEYLTNGKYSEISREVYLEYYRELLPTLERIGLTIREKDDEFFELCAPSGRTRHYAGGIKQMISHWIGAIGYARQNESESVWLGEIVFDFGEEQKNTLEKYKNDYSILAEGLKNSKYKPANLLVLPKLITYQELYGNNRQYNILKRIEEYYELTR